jgi:3-deoxy-manno-octulosonate cytidylyltransferase (CMP-KDO synthetase)
LQGDEPFVKPEMLVSLVEPYLNGKMIPMSTLACPLDLDREYNDPNTVKVLVNKKNDALYFSRSPIPFFRQQVEYVPLYMHLGMYAYTRDFLLEYTKMEQTPLEKAESLEQLRALENGIPICVCQTPHRILEVNNQQELDLARKFAENLV